MGNPHKILSYSMNCIIAVNDSDSEETLEYRLTFYGLLLTVGVIVLILGLELLVYFVK